MLEDILERIKNQLDPAVINFRAVLNPSSFDPDLEAGGFS